MMKRIIRYVPWPWEIVCLVCDYLDPKTLAVASCVNKSWNNLMSSEFLWECICGRYYPSLLKLHRSSSSSDTNNATFSHRSFYAMAASKRPSLNDLVFAIHIHNNGTRSRSRRRSFSILKPCSELKQNRDGLFQFQFNINIEAEDQADFSANTTWVRWNVLKKTFKKNVLATARRPSNPESGIKAEIRLELARQKISVGLVNSLSGRYLTLDHALRYLQCFIPA